MGSILFGALLIALGGYNLLRLHGVMGAPDDDAAREANERWRSEKRGLKQTIFWLCIVFGALGVTGVVEI